MADTTPNLTLPYLAASQAQKHVTHNEALRLLDALTQLRIDSFDAVSPPVSPANGEVHAIGVGAAGAWAGQDGRLAMFADNAWAFLAPKDGWRAWGLAETELRVYSGGVWLAVVAPLQNLDGLGIGATSDATNRLSVASAASLFSHEGSDHQLKINKAASADTASMLFQSNWSGRAEMGLAGDDDFRIKVSGDGSSFSDALTARAADGVITVPCLMSGKITVANDAVGSISTPGAGGMIAISLVDPNFPQAAHSGIFSYDAGPSLALHTMAKGPSLENQGTNLLSGTTGTDGRSSLAVQVDEVQIENRHGGTRTYAYSFINTY
ncbi:DUF2793 domain-containing protein [Profundibacter sp.]